MPANTAPVFPIVPKVSWGKVLTADATAVKNHDGTTANAVLVFTAGANGARIEEIKALPLGTNAATVLRIFINNGQDPTVATNNALYEEITCPSTSITETMQQSELILINKDSSALILPPGYRLYAAVGTTVATGLQVTVIGGDY